MVSLEALGASPGGAVTGADLGGSSKYSNKKQSEKYEIVPNLPQLLCRYRKRTDIYYSTWSFENVAKNCQFQFLDPHPLH